jgi:L,D-transpeptidase ErfK/SrfK
LIKFLFLVPLLFTPELISQSEPQLLLSPRHVRLEVSRTRRQLTVFQNQQPIATYPVAIGKPGWETPLGTWKINAKIAKPSWTNFKSGRVVPPGKNNPMGSMWIGYYKDANGEVGFHGTQQTSSVGKASSHGCNRMLEKDVQALSKLVEIGDEVRVVE